MFLMGNKLVTKTHFLIGINRVNYEIIVYFSNLYKIILMSKRIQHIESEIIDQYLWNDDSFKPWFIGFSGGKDSTVLLQIVWRALEKIRDTNIGSLRREIYVVCNDTMVENPIITEYVDRILQRIDKAAREQSLPIHVKKTTPRLEDSFWVNLIGKGYPAPNNLFRWCTERLKIKPTSRFLTDKVNENGHAVILIGTRSDESASRARSIKKHEIKGKRLTKHQQLQNTFVYAPLKELLTEEIWGYINTQDAPWGGTNQELFRIYSDANANDYECPTMVTNKDHSSCGQSRFGCWVCTVVREDKSMAALINNGFEWLRPLLDFRDSLVKERNIPENRMVTRRNGSDDSLGPYEPQYRAKILSRLLETQLQIQQIKPSLELISNQELIAIQVIWQRDFIFNLKVADIFNNVFNKELDMKNISEKIEKEKDLLKKSCKSDNDYFNLVEELLTLQKNKSLMNKKRGLKDDIENRIEAFLKNK
jgi:DNA sulfur modification protein DndC